MKLVVVLLLLIFTLDSNTLIPPCAKILPRVAYSTIKAVKMVNKNNQKSGAENVYRKTCLAVVESESTVMMLNRMIRSGIATNDVMSFSMNQAKLRRIHKEPSRKIEKAAMKLKRNDAIAHSKRLRQQRYRAKLHIFEVYGTEGRNKATKLIGNINKNIRGYKRAIVKEKLDKCDHLKAKYEYTKVKTLESCQRGVKSLLEELEVFNSVPVVEPPLGPLVCHPSIALSEEELAVLNRGPKFMVRNKVSKSDFLLEVEKGIVKHKYNVINNCKADDDCITQIQDGGKIDNMKRADQSLFSNNLFM